MSIREINFPSANGRDTVKAWAYTPLCKPRGIIQLIHGYGEHSRRYLHMISKFQAAGFVVVADDHIGHGKTGYDAGTLGDPHSGGYMTYLKDEKSLHDIAVEAFPNIPYMVFGHSWGSMLARAYAAHYGEDITALMLCGLCSQWKGCEVEYENPAFKADYEADPNQPAGEWFDKVFSGMTDRVENPTAPPIGSPTTRTLSLITPATCSTHLTLPLSWFGILSSCTISSRVTNGLPWCRPGSLSI